ncbi:hypothetical protein ACFRCI_41305 [Streptomyces sp. NPDC056638]|uniref:hypothetical protein n=1 Tax=Streptomyces sp. NPDC056638 TaxID=3345887 RepID=UPI0036AACFC6
MQRPAAHRLDVEPVPLQPRVGRGITFVDRDADGETTIEWYDNSSDQSYDLLFSRH